VSAKPPLERVLVRFSHRDAGGAVAITCVWRMPDGSEHTEERAFGRHEMADASALLAQLEEQMTGKPPMET
jgi:hypothetical protein